MNLTHYSDRDLDGFYTYELLADGQPVGLIQYVSENNWEYTLGDRTENGFSSYMQCFRKACWVHKQAVTNTQQILIAA